MVEEATPPPRKVEGYDETTDRNGWIDAASPFPYNDKIETLGARKITPISISMAIYHIFMIFRPVATVLSRKKNYDHTPSKFYPMAVDFFGLFFPHFDTIPPSSASAGSTKFARACWCWYVDIVARCYGTLYRSRLSSGTRCAFSWAFCSRNHSTKIDIRLPDKSEILDMTTISKSELLIHLPPCQNLVLSIFRSKLDQHLPDPWTDTRTFVWPTSIPEVQKQIKSDLDG